MRDIEADIKADFDVSIILPFYKKLKDLKLTLPVNQSYFRRNGIEIVLVMDECSEKNELLDFIRQYPFINWKIIVNEYPHVWRNPAKALNVGIKNASKKYVLLMDPESELTSDIILAMRKMAVYYEDCFFVGRVAFVDYDYVPTPESLIVLGHWSYGSLLVKKEFLFFIGGYDEEYERWGGDDDNIRARLQMSGIRKVMLKDCVLLHREHATELEEHRKKKKNVFALRDKNELKESFYPNSYLANKKKGDAWGTDFSKVVFDSGLRVNKI